MYVKVFELVYTCSMVQVYLPFGYPLVSGEFSQSLIYQGNIVRLYTLPKDPRTADQTFERKFFADVIRMRSTCGTFGKGAARAALGSKWGTVLYQLVRADDGGWWSESVQQWDEGNDVQRENWRQMAPFQATYNDPGKVYYCLARAMMQYVNNYTGLVWKGDIWDMSQDQEASEWWALVAKDELQKQLIGDEHASVEYVGNWTQYFDGAASGGKYHHATNDVANRCRVFYYGRNVQLYYFRSVNYYTADVYIDGLLVGSVDQHVGGTGTYYQLFENSYRGLHVIEVRCRVNGAVNVDGFEFF